MATDDLDAAMKEYYAEDVEELERALRYEPLYKAIIKRNVGLVDGMLEQEHRGRFATFVVRRRENVVDVSWTFNPQLGDPGQYDVVGRVCLIPLIPDPAPEKVYLRTIMKAVGNGNIKVALRAGVPQLFEFTLTKTESFKVEKSISYLDVVRFQVVVPLSDEQQKILERVKKLDPRPEDLARDELQAELRVQDALDDGLKEAIAKIKSQSLPPEEEERRIEDLRDRANSLKAKYGL